MGIISRAISINIVASCSEGVLVILLFLGDLHLLMVIPGVCRLIFPTIRSNLLNGVMPFSRR